ncbi:MAG: hypothetical protein MK066_12795, partial [Crocinitomicaceae bacterium]|nr:hypothetical protein [Crocinitomicaceae bacterium]
GRERSRQDFERIKGVRIWKTKSIAFPSFDEKGKGVGEGVLMDDLIMTPALGEKGMTSDLHANHLGNNIVGAGAEALLILGIGQPCPNQCPGGPRFFFQYS